MKKYIILIFQFELSHTLDSTTTTLSQAGTMFARFQKKLHSTFQDDTDGLEVPGSKRPPNTAFRQQRLKSWQPILLPQSVLPILVVIACIFTPIGIGLMVSSTHVQDLTINYSACHNLAQETFSDVPKKYVKYHFKDPVTVKPRWRVYNDPTDDTQVCQLNFQIPNDVKEHIYVYYKLTNFYQNHRKYVESFDRKQLAGHAIPWEDLNTSCKPIRSQGNKTVYPCGLIANSMFNDTFQNSFEHFKVDNNDDDDNSTTNYDYFLTNKKISWSIDRKKRFKMTNYNVTDIVPPPNWSNRFPDGYTKDNLPNLQEWEELQVWMRNAALPKFYKLALKNETAKFLPSGNYTFKIGLNYPTSIFGGSKSIVITTLGAIGTRNLSLSILFLIVSGIMVLFAILFLIKIVFQPRILADQSSLRLSDNNDEIVDITNEFDRDLANDKKIFDDISPLREII